jgi:hypothetical protein
METTGKLGPTVAGLTNLSPGQIPRVELGEILTKKWAC